MHSVGGRALRKSVAKLNERTTVSHERRVEDVHILTGIANEPWQLVDADHLDRQFGKEVQRALRDLARPGESHVSTARRILQSAWNSTL